jgi:hypothetical protein
MAIYEEAAEQPAEKKANQVHAAILEADRERNLLTGVR